MFYSKPLICIHNLSYQYENNVVLEHIHLDINDGEYIGIVGPNGGGKTTLIKLILGILNDTKNTINISKSTKFGYIPQRLSSSGLDFPAKVSEILKNSFDKFDETKYQELLSLCEIKDLESRLLTDLSGGQRQKVFIARSLIAEPDYLILDEPTTGIDPEYQVKFWELLKQLNEVNKIGIIIISHDSHQIQSNAKRLITIDKKIMTDSTPQNHNHVH